MKIYLLENEELDVIRVSLLLQELGLPEPVVFRSVAELSELDLTEVPPEALFIFDFELDDGTGSDAAKWLRSSSATAAQAGIVVLTGSFDGAVATELTRSDVDELCFKSTVNAEGLRLAIQRADRARLGRMSRLLYRTRLRSVATMLAHDLRSPLSGVLYGTEVLAQEPDLSESAARVVALMHSNIQEALAMINERLRSIAVEPSRDLAMRLDQVVMSDLATELREIYALKLEARKGTIDELISEPFVGSRDAILEILVNLVGNALKHAVARNLLITLWADRTPDGVSIYVRDNGTNSDPDRINGFLDGTDTPSGHGLLYIMELTRAMGGTLRCSGDGASYLEYCLHIPTHPETGP